MCVCVCVCMCVCVCVRARIFCIVMLEPLSTVFSPDNIFHLDVHYACYTMLVQRYEPQGRRLTNFHYYYYNNTTKPSKQGLLIRDGDAARGNNVTGSGLVTATASLQSFWQYIRIRQQKQTFLFCFTLCGDRALTLSLSADLYCRFNFLPKKVSKSLSKPETLN